MTDADRASMTDADRASMTDADRASMTDADRASMTDADRAAMTDADHAITSAITNMSVAEVRKSLAFMRKEWAKHSCVLPFFPCQHLPNTNMPVSEFAFRFVMGHHHKRHQKSAAE
jgi:hypothetical protein